MIGAFEGYRRYPYNDPAGHATIGYGHLLHLGNVTPADRANYPNGLTRAEARELLLYDARIAERAVQTLVLAHRPLGQGQYDALVSFTFNLGPGALERSNLRRVVNERPGSPGARAIDAEFLKWVHAGGVVLPGLVTRREAEARLFLQGRYPQTDADDT